MVIYKLMTPTAPPSGADVTGMPKLSHQVCFLVVAGLPKSASSHLRMVATSKFHKIHGSWFQEEMEEHLEDW
jgi:hypothetical protein